MRGGITCTSLSRASAMLLARPQHRIPRSCHSALRGDSPGTPPVRVTHALSGRNQICGVQSGSSFLLSSVVTALGISTGKLQTVQSAMHMANASAHPIYGSERQHRLIARTWHGACSYCTSRGPSNCSVLPCQHNAAPAALQCFWLCTHFDQPCLSFE